MQFYMFQMDESQPERCAEMLARRGFSAVIGVSSARSIAALHHGDICLESDEASGTAFIVTLPENAK